MQRVDGQMNGNTNIQVNGNVYGGIHVHNGVPPLAASASPREPRSDDTSWVWMLAKVFGCIVVGGLAVFGGIVVVSALLVAAIGVLGLALAWWLVCRAANGIIFAETHVVSARDIVSVVPNVVRGVRALASGDRVNEIETTEMTRYVE